ncbi:MAG TPA: purine-nucleoside phosphorylase [Ignavibacteria bacterium]|jgi:purine-nucleoside phosphorylase
MTEQKKKIFESANFLKGKNPFKKISPFAIVTYYNPSFIKAFKIVKRVSYKDIPPPFSSGNEKLNGDVLFAAHKNKNLIILNGHVNYYDGYDMNDAAHYIYVLQALGVAKILFIDEVGHLNPRFKAGSVALIYDHINLMGNNPLIGENDNSIGPRFPDMSNAYDEKWTADIEKFLIDKKFRFYPSVYIGVTGPETETEAECRLYREIGADVLGYCLVPENIAAVHAGLSCAAFGIISRELVADRLVEISEEEKLSNRQKAEKSFASILAELVSSIK